jgi:hypothetical protein
MKSRLLWIAILAVGLSALYFGIARPQVTAIPKTLSEPLADLKPPGPPPLAPPSLEIPTMPAIRPPPLATPIVRFDALLSRPEVPIQNGATIDFSTGGPVVKMQGKDQEALNAGLKEIIEAAKATTFEANPK